MSMRRNPLPPPPNGGVPINVPIVGQPEYHMACSRGHVEKTGHPFSITIPGEPPTLLQLCRMCWINFVAMFGARPLVAEEIAAFERAQEPGHGGGH